MSTGRRWDGGAGRLSAEGWSVYRDVEDLVDFESITGSVERGLGRSKALLAYYSPSYPTRRARQWELTAPFLAAQRRGRPAPARAGRQTRERRWVI